MSETNCTRVALLLFFTGIVACLKAISVTPVDITSFFYDWRCWVWILGLTAIFAQLIELAEREEGGE